MFEYLILILVGSGGLPTAYYSYYWRDLSKWDLLFIAVFMMIEIPWDYIAFNFWNIYDPVRTHQLGVSLMGLPIEEFLFMFFLPFQFTAAYKLVARIKQKDWLKHSRMVL